MSVDWREKGAIYPVKDQQVWAYAATAQIESYIQIQEVEDIPILSAQQVCHQDSLPKVLLIIFVTFPGDCLHF